MAKGQHASQHHSAEIIAHQRGHESSSSASRQVSRGRSQKQQGGAAQRDRGETTDLVEGPYPIEIADQRDGAHGHSGQCRMWEGCWSFDTGWSR